MKSVQVPQPVVNGPVTGNRLAGQIQSNPITQALRLVEASRDYTPPFVLSTYGSPGAGKSTLAGSAPGDIGVILMEHKSKSSIIRAAQANGKRVIVPQDPATGLEMSFIRVENPMALTMLPDACLVVGSAMCKDLKPPQVQEMMQEIGDGITVDGPRPGCCKRHHYRWGVNRAKWAMFQMAAEPSIKTIVIDTFGQFVQDVSYANYGKDGVIEPGDFGFAPRQDMNQELRDVLNSICHKHLILTHQSSTVWKDKKPTNASKASSLFKGLGHYATVMIEQWRNDSVPAGGDGRYGITVMDCQENAALIGTSPLFDDAITFQMLALQVYPESDPDDYE